MSFSAMIHVIGIPVARPNVPGDTNEITQVAVVLDLIGTRPGRTMATWTQHEPLEKKLEACAGW